MPTLDATVTAFVPGDDLSLRRTITRGSSGDEVLPTGVTVSKAWLTVKSSPADADVDALFQKEITTVAVAGTGEIEDDGTGDTDPVLRFDLVPADTLLIGTTRKHYDVQILTSGSKLHTPERGRIYGSVDQVTLATS